MSEQSIDNAQQQARACLERADNARPQWLWRRVWTRRARKWRAIANELMDADRASIKSNIIESIKRDNHPFADRNAGYTIPAGPPPGWEHAPGTSCPSMVVSGPATAQRDTSPPASRYATQNNVDFDETITRRQLIEWVDDTEGMDPFMNWLTGSAHAWPNFVASYR